jgi:predicted RNA-binding Zn ribbon-like protein
VYNNFGRADSVGRGKAKQSSDWKDGFLFLGNQLALDFLNTRPVQNGEPMELLGDFGAVLRWFQTAGLLNSIEAANLQQRWGEPGRALQVVESMSELRERLRKEVIAWEGGRGVNDSTIKELNRLMAEHPMLTRLKASGKGPSTELYFKLQQPEDLFAPLASSAADLFANTERKRVRKCDRCVLHFHDTSKKGTRRWCSMQLCGNRLKVAAYAARQHMSTHK